jgi:transcriptional regulator with XRE-family HTH domain
MSTSHPFDPDWQRLGERMVILRRRAHKSVRELAKDIGASHSTIQRLERGDPGIGFDIIYRVLAALGRLDMPIGRLGSPDDDLT